MNEILGLLKRKGYDVELVGNEIRFYDFNGYRFEVVEYAATKICDFITDNWDYDCSYEISDGNEYLIIHIF